MPTSRKRRPKRSGSPQPRSGLPPAGSAERPRHLALLRATDEAERRGDASAALDLMDAHPVDDLFWRPWRVRLLLQLAMFDPWLPAWATSRWILAQALQHLDDRPGRGVGERRVHRALDRAIELRGGRGRLPGLDPADALCRVIDHDWVFRQLHLYELGGLRHFLDRVASADLVAGADRIREWGAAPMGGFLLLEHRPGTVAWGDYATGERVVTANIGSASLAVPDESVIGRLVPIEGGRMFETAPLIVPDTVAREVSRDPSGWLEALRSVPGGTASPEVCAAGDVTGFLSDVPMAVWLEVVADAGGHRDLTSDVTPEALAASTLGFARRTLDPSTLLGELDPWSSIGAALLSPSLLAPLVQALAPADRELLGRLGEELAEPAASVCRTLARALPRVA